MEKINSLQDFQSKSKGSEITYILLYKSGSALNDCALNSVKEAAEKIKNVSIFETDVTHVRDVHPHFQIDSVPSFLEIQNGKLINNYKGCNTVNFYVNAIEKAVFNAQNPDAKPAHRVTVYSTPSCSWCNTLKTYFKQQNVPFTDIDVSRNQQAAQEMVRRSGQQGVPQTDIDGTIVVGFDKTRINNLLGLK
jgi:glutaredoxin-like YruB-family protein